MTPEWLSVAGAILAAGLLLPLALAGYRMVRGPSHADRFVALDMLTGVAIAFAAAIAMATGQSAFLDVGLGLALINFVATCAFARFLERRTRT